MDNATRWNSSLHIMKQLGDLRSSANQVIQTMKTDSLSVAEREDLVNLKPNRQTCCRLMPIASYVARPAVPPTEILCSQDTKQIYDAGFKCTIWTYSAAYQ